MRLPTYRKEEGNISGFGQQLAIARGNQQVTIEECWVIKNGGAFQNGVALASRPLGSEDSSKFEENHFSHSGSDVSE